MIENWGSKTWPGSIFVSDILQLTPNYVWWWISIAYFPVGDSQLNGLLVVHKILLYQLNLFECLGNTVFLLEWDESKTKIFLFALSLNLLNLIINIFEFVLVIILCINNLLVALKGASNFHFLSLSVSIIKLFGLLQVLFISFTVFNQFVNISNLSKYLYLKYILMSKS